MEKELNPSFVITDIDDDELIAELYVESKEVLLSVSSELGSACVLISKSQLPFLIESLKDFQKQM